MSGYYEWQSTPSGKQPWYFTASDGSPLLTAAGLWDEWKDRLHDCSVYVLLRMTRGEVLRYAIAYALRRSRKIIRGLKKGLSEYERHAVADHVVAQLKERGDPWRLNEEAPTAKPPTT